MNAYVIFFSEGYIVEKAKKRKKDNKMSPAIIKKKVKIEPKKQDKNEDFKSRFLKKLEGKKQELEDTIKHLKNSQKEDLGKISVDSFIDDLDRADREISAQTFYKLLDRKNKELERINFLIRRVQQEQDFGFCEECGRQIPEKRLLILPEAIYCVPCQQEMEKAELRINLAKTPNASTQWKNEFQTNSNEDLDDEGLLIKPDTEHVSFTDMEEVELTEDQPEPQEN
jgi:DnaK suppressor protein